MADYIVILGAGESGVGAAILAQTKGYDVFVSDYGKISTHYINKLNKHSVRWEENNHSEDLILKADLIVKSPGIPDTSPLILKIQNLSIPIISEIEFAGRYTDAKMICITGSNGKTTTSLLTYHMLKKAGFNVGLAGNVGRSLALQVAEKDYSHYVVELSSFQLDGMFHFKSDIAVLLNITPDHLDRYEYNMQNYIDSKFRILQNQKQSDVFIFCSDDEIINKELLNRNILSEKYPFGLDYKPVNTAFIAGEDFVIKSDDLDFFMDKKNLSLKGKHNAYNSMAAGIAGNILGIKKEIIRESLSDFIGVEHRLESFLKIKDVCFINDSKATNINSVWYALESMDTPVVWIVGGVDKGNDYNVIKQLVNEKVKAIVCLGTDNTKIHEAFFDIEKPIVDTLSMKEAVAKAFALSEKNDTVLLSPACASFDLFKSYEDRGSQFKNEVRNL